MVAAVLAVAVVPSAFAHATLLETTPSNDAVVAAAPDRVVLRFDEPIETVLGSVRVYGGDAKRVDNGEETRPQPEEVTVGLPTGLAKGTYTVTWRVISADSHPVRGAFVFHVGKPGADAAGVASEVLDANGGSGTVDFAFGVVRFVNLLLILLCVGGAVMLTLALQDAPRRVGTSVWWALAGLSALLAVASLAWIGMEGAQASGLGLGSAFRPSLINDVAGTRFGEVWVSRAIVAAALAVVAVIAARSGAGRRAWLGVFAVVFVVEIAATPRAVRPRTRRGLAVARQ